MIHACSTSRAKHSGLAFTRVGCRENLAAFYRAVGPAPYFSVTHDELADGGWWVDRGWRLGPRRLGISLLDVLRATE